MDSTPPANPYTGPLIVNSREQMRAYLAHTLAGRRHGWGHLALRPNSVARSAPCRFCEGVAAPAQGPALFWDADPLCSACGAQVAPELTLYLAVLLRTLPEGGGG